MRTLGLVIRPLRRLRRGPALALIAALVAGGAVAGVVVVKLRPGPCSAAAESAPFSGTPVARPSPPPITAAVRSVGVYTPGFPGAVAALDQVAGVTGRRPDIVMWYAHWGGPDSAPDVAAISTVLARGAVPMITWMTDDPTVGNASDPASQSAYRDGRVAAGGYDGYVRTWASALRSVPGTVMLRLDHEMNCNWTSWAAGVGGQTADDYVAMWRHVHGVFSAMGVSNVRWVWSPNVATAGPDPLRALYPGDDVVDVVGLDGYNWGTSQPGKHWQSFDDLFSASIADIGSVSARPLLLTEIGCAEVGGDKAAWITDFLGRLRDLPQVAGFVWFDADKETDWRIDSSPAAAAAFRTGIARLEG